MYGRGGTLLIAQGEAAVRAEEGGGHVHIGVARQAEGGGGGVGSKYRGQLPEDRLTWSDVPGRHYVATHSGVLLDDEGVTHGLRAVDQEVVLQITV